MVLVCVLSTCIDRIDVPLRSEQPQLVVEGQITNEAPPYTVKLSYTGHYSSTQNPADQFVEGAQVSLADDQGHITQFIRAGMGLYQTSDSTFRGQIGRSYSLTVVLSDGKRYTSKPERMPAVAPIDSISTRILQSPNITQPYQIAYSINTLDPANEKNYYRWTAYGIINRLSTGVPCCMGCISICRNSCWPTLSTNAVNIYTDEAINGNPIRDHLVLQLPIYSYSPQLVEVQQYGITQANYQFLKLYQQQSDRTGSIFDPLPAPVTGNVVNMDNPLDPARGYFAVTSIRRKRFRMQDYSSSPFYGAMASFFYTQYINRPLGDCRNTYGPSFLTEPDGWQ